jgi:uncharacterized membrane protein YccC
MKMAIKLLIIIMAVALITVGLYAYPDTRPMMIDFFGNSLNTLGNGFNLLITNPIWLTYIQPYWGWIIFPLGCVIGALATKLIYFDWYVKGGARKAQDMLGRPGVQSMGEPRGTVTQEKPVPVSTKEEQK